MTAKRQRKQYPKPDPGPIHVPPHYPHAPISPYRPEEPKPLPPLPRAPDPGAWQYILHFGFGPAFGVALLFLPNMLGFHPPRRNIFNILVWMMIGFFIVVAIREKIENWIKRRKARKKQQLEKQQEEKEQK